MSRDKMSTKIMEIAEVTDSEMNTELDYFSGMSKKEIEDYMEVEDEMNREKAEQYYQDVQIITR